MDYIKLFETHADYNTYITGQDKILPNVSYCENENEVHYNPWVETMVVAKFNVTSTSSATTICAGLSPNISKMYVDGVEQSSTSTTFTFDTIGEHSIKYELIDDTTIGNGAFANCTSLTSITIPNSVTTIGNSAFAACSGLTSVTIPNNVTTIGSEAFRGCIGLTDITIPNSVTFINGGVFYNCVGLTSVTIGNSVTSIGIQLFNGCRILESVTIKATNPPELTWDNDMFVNSTNCPIYVPSESVEAYKTAQYWSTYASRIQAIP